ncbi:hypothetical protein [Bythopirellula goksoeyrii]|uniref:PEP-CTERM protein-sorting domain-containing protein n=1 Tax=Bythopirellula goksoeyrii TaxID=1400387 RepID=A0A5B9QIG6_9BACT|nr:hypothetical protein [Bythopirellula goksoeyrii]QEG33933.1 hypothetical protein Pr1d_12040 [Bythopirellula goksoeyrii]
MMLRQCSVAFVFGLPVLLLSVHSYAAVSVSVGDFSFEEEIAPPTAEVVDGPGTWAQAWNGGFADPSFLPVTQPLYPNQDGNYLGNIFETADSGFAALYQDVVQIEEGTYTFTIGVAHEPDAEPTSAPFLLNFEAVGYGGPTVLVDSFSFPVGTLNSSGLTDLEVEVTFPSGHPEIGRTFRPVLLTTGADAGSNPSDPRASYMMDNVRIDFEPAVGASRSIRVGQPSFDPVAWKLPSGTGDDATSYRPTTPLFASQIGDQLGALTVRTLGGWGAAFYQDTTTIQEGTYSLTVGVAHDPNYQPTTSPFLINFESVASDGNVTLLGENIFPVGSANSSDLTDLTATLEIPSGMPNIGETLRLVLLTTGEDAGSNPGAADPRAIYLLDNVRLEFESAGGSFLAADFNESGMVDGEDLPFWQGAYGLNADGDADDDNDSDGADFLVWQRQYGTFPLAANSTAVPEPATVFIALTSLISVCGLRRRILKQTEGLRC